MTLSIDKSSLSRKNKTDCRLKAFSIALNYEGISYSPSDIMLDANAITFEFLNFNKKGLEEGTCYKYSDWIFTRFV